MTTFVRICAVLALLSAACGATRPAPVSALNEYSEALRSGDYDKAYSMMSEEFRQTHTKEEFARVMKENKAEVSETASRLRGTHRRVQVTAWFDYGAGDRMKLVLEDGKWRVASNPVVFYSQATPRDALRSFVRAYKLERWDIMLRLVPKAYAEKMDEATVERQFKGPRREEVGMMMSRIEANIGAPIQDKGTEARMPYDDAEVVFTREDGLWKIKDPEDK